MQLRSAAIVGATGLVGSQCLERLLDSPHYSEVVTLGRKPMATRAARHRHYLVDFERPATLAPRLQVQDLFLCLGTTLKKAGSQSAFRRVDFDYNLETAKSARRAGCQQLLLVSALGANAQSRVFYNRVKGELEDAVRQLDFVAHHVFRPSLLLGTREESRPAERIGQALAPVLTPLLRGPLRAYRPIEAHVVGEAMVRVAERATPGMHFYESKVIAELGAGP